MGKDNFVTGSWIFAKYLRYLKGIFLANTSFGLKDRSLFLSEWTEVKKQQLLFRHKQRNSQTILSCRTRRKSLISRGRKCRKETPASWTASGWKLKTKRNFKTWLRSKHVVSYQMSEPAVTARLLGNRETDIQDYRRSRHRMSFKWIQRRRSRDIFGTWINFNTNYPTWTKYHIYSRKSP